MMRMVRNKKAVAPTIALFLLTVANGSHSRAEESGTEERVLVVGDEEARKRATGSVAVLDEQTLARQRNDDIHRILRYVPGVNVQEEEGYGLRPNIGFRGTGSERSSNISLMEDGVLIAPAPYAAPSAYYFPTTGRMESIEVRKGTASIRQGPHTTGGVLNLLSTRIPDRLSANVRLFGGGDDTFRGHAWAGDSRERFGWVVESFRQSTDGFKRLDGGGETGFELEDYMAKLRVNSGAGARGYHALELKLGHTEQEGDETYLGLTDADFAATPLRRYAASAADRIETDHDQLQARYLGRFNDRYDLTVTAYRNEFFRNWSKLQSAGGVSLAAVLGDPQSYATELGWLDGSSDSPDDALALRNNRRDYLSQGLDARVGVHLPGHQIEFGLRYHEDEEDRFQEEDDYRIVAGVLERTTAGAPGSQANRVESASAWSAFAQDTIRLGEVTLVPGVRVESIELRRDDYGGADPARSGAELSVRRNSVDAVIPGIGAHWQLDEAHGVHASVHRGFAPPGSSPTDEEERSVNYEAGWRWFGGRAQSEVTAFLNDYRNLLGADTLSSGGSGSGDLYNGGEARVAGVELSGGLELKSASGLRVPLRAAYTFTDAEFRNAFDSDFSPWGEVAVGDELPYVAEHQLTVAIGLVAERWSVDLDANWLSEMRTEAGSGPIPAGSGTDARLVLDLAARTRIADGVKLFGQVRNLTDANYIAARRPAGLRPGLSRTALVGVELAF